MMHESKKYSPSLYIYYAFTLFMDCFDYELDNQNKKI